MNTDKIKQIVEEEVMEKLRTEIERKTRNEFSKISPIVLVEMKKFVSSKKFISFLKNETARQMDSLFRDRHFEYYLSADDRKKFGILLSRAVLKSIRGK